MIEFRAEPKPKIALLLDNRVEVTFTTTKSAVRAFESIKERDLTVTVKEYRPKRSLSQNAYLWVLLGQLAQKVELSKEEVYKSFVRDYGVFEILPIKKEAVKDFCYRWSKQGLAWFTEDLGESKLNGYTKLIAYYGSSTYNTQEMKRLIDAVVAECKAQGIDTMPVADIMLLMNEND